MTVPEPRPEGRRAPALLAWPIVAALGIALATLPHLVRWWLVGDPTYFADGDGLLYHTWLREALFRGHPWMVDGVHDGRPPMMHPSLLLVPPALVAHALGGTPFLLGLVARTIAVEERQPVIATDMRRWRRSASARGYSLRMR